MALLVAGLGIVVALTMKQTGEIRYRGGLLVIPVSPVSIKIASDEGRASYLMLGHPDMAGLFTLRGGPLGWGPGDQFGGFIVVPSASNESIQLTALIQQRSRFFTQYDFQVRTLPPPPP